MSHVIFQDIYKGQISKILMAKKSFIMIIY